MSKCKICRAEFVRRSMSHKCCSAECAATWVAKENARKEARKARDERRQDAAARLNIKPMRYWLDKTQRDVNEYVRWRDHGLGCISCDKPATWGGQWHGSHFRSVGASPATRFNLWGINKACSQCNTHLSGNIANYRPRLIEKIGEDRYLWLMAQNGRAGYTRDYLERLGRVMRKKTRRLKKRLGIE